MRKVKLYALSTCGWCRKTKAFLEAHGIDYECQDVDLLTGTARTRVLEEVDRWNPQRSFPTLVVDEHKVVVGFNEDRLREVLGL
ncbi:MAG: glutaredoxin family protein [Anaerolineae bacterium]